MRSRILLFAASLCVCVPTLARAQETKTAPLVVRVQSLDEQKANLGYFAELVGREEFKLFVNFFAAPGIDGAKPMGLYARLGAKPAECALIGMAPITSEKAFTDALSLFKVKLTKLDGGLFGVNDAPHPLHVRFADGYAYLAHGAKGWLAADKLLDPKTLSADADAFTITLRPDLVPDSLKKEVTDWIIDTSKLAQQFTIPFESEKHRALRKEAIQLATDEHLMWIKDATQIVHSVKVDRAANRITAETKLSAKPNSKLAARFGLGKGPSLFAAMTAGDSVMSGAGHFQIPAEHRKFLGDVVDEMMTHVETHAKAWHKESDIPLAKSLAASIKAGDVDHGFNMRGPGEKGLYTIVGGAKVKDGATIDKALQDRIKDLPETYQKLFTMSAEAAGAIKIHRFDIPEKLQPLLKHHEKTFGKAPIWFAFRGDAMLVATGENGLPALKEALAAQPKAAPAGQFTMSVARLAAAHGKSYPAIAKATQHAFGNDKNAGRINVVVETGDTVAIRLDVDTSIMKFAAKAIMAR